MVSMLTKFVFVHFLPQNPSRINPFAFQLFRGLVNSLNSLKTCNEQLHDELRDEVSDQKRG